METKQTQPVNVIAVSKQATLKTIMADIGDLPEKLMADVNQQNLEMDGPMIFVYEGCTGDCESPFELKITQPVKNSSDYKGAYEVTTLEPFKCVERTYQGNMNDMGSKGYDPFIADIEKSGLTMTDQCREIYTLFEGPDSDSNLTELQMGVA
ncbi:MAG: hypothetical protein MI867_11775 [Pseudomonadales bacterium]|nr:hypothetical protein [Pseudomonadales bacterium]